MAIVVSDTSPVRALANLGLLDLLGKLFGTVYVPPAVAAELASPRGLSIAVDVQRLDCIAIAQPTNQQQLAELGADRRLDPGEREAIALAIEKRALLLMDERAGAKVAAAHGLTVVGVAGVLIRAKKAGLVPAVAPLLVHLRDVYRFHVSDQLLQTAKQLAQEI